jgi:hypothetical protein
MKVECICKRPMAKKFGSATVFAAARAPDNQIRFDQRDLRRLGHIGDQREQPVDY